MWWWSIWAFEFSMLKWYVERHGRIVSERTDDVLSFGLATFFVCLFIYFLSLIFFLLFSIVVVCSERVFLCFYIFLFFIIFLFCFIWTSSSSQWLEILLGPIRFSLTQTHTYTHKPTTKHTFSLPYFSIHSVFGIDSTMVRSIGNEICSTCVSNVETEQNAK